MCCAPCTRMLAVGRSRWGSGAGDRADVECAVATPVSCPLKPPPALGAVDPLPDLAPSWNVARVQQAMVVQRHKNLGERAPRPSALEPVTVASAEDVEQVRMPMSMPSRTVRDFWHVPQCVPPKHDA